MKIYRRWMESRLREALRTWRIVSNAGARQCANQHIHPFPSFSPKKQVPPKTVPLFSQILQLNNLK